MNKPIFPNGLTPALAAELYRRGMNTVEIAARYGTNPKQVSRLLDRAGQPRRPRGQNLASDRPRGREVSDESRGRIGRSQSRRWGEMPAARRAALSRASSERVRGRADFGPSGAANLRRASAEGSRIARAVVAALAAAGNPVDPFPVVRLGGRAVRPSCVVAREGVRPVAVLVRGPSHYRPVFGEEKLAAQQRADAAAEDLLAAHRYSVVVAEVDRRSVSQTYLADLCAAVLRAVPASRHTRHVVARA